jgi:hypothetical protein
MLVMLPLKPQNNAISSNYRKCFERFESMKSATHNNKPFNFDHYASKYRVRHIYGNACFLLFLNETNRCIVCYLDELVAKNYLNNSQTYMFSLTILIFKDSLQSMQESFTGGMQHFLRDQVPLSCQFRLQTIQRIMRFSADPAL